MNEFREWLSDNLRYIMLGVGILLGLVVIFFGIRFITSAIVSNPNTQQEADATVTPTETPTPTPTPTVEVLVMEDIVENGVPEITALIQEYYTAIANNDLDTLRTLVDTLSIEDEAVITADTVTSYSDIRVFTKVTNTSGVYIVFASYKYTLSGINTAVPGLTQLCVHTANDGSLYISTAGPNADLQAEIDETMRSSDVQNLIGNVQSQYETALDSDPSLYAFFHGSQSGTSTGSGSSTTGSNNSNSTGSNNAIGSSNSTSGSNNSTSSSNSTSGSNNSSSNTGNSSSNSSNTGNSSSNSNKTGSTSNSGSNSSSSDADVTPEPTWAPGSRPTVDTDGGIIPTPEPPEENKLELKERAYLYEKADTSSSTIRPYPANTQMVKLSESGDFYEVDINGEVGYMLKSSFK